LFQGREGPCSLRRDGLKPITVKGGNGRAVGGRFTSHLRVAKDRAPGPLGQDKYGDPSPAAQDDTSENGGLRGAAGLLEIAVVEIAVVEI